MIEMTVGLPMLSTRYIGWLAMESLCRQENINFEWELIIAEEIKEKYNPMGYQEIFKYKDRLKNVGCVNIRYIPIQNKALLTYKWSLLANYATNSSNIFVIKAADCYSYSKRLSETFELFKDDIDFVSSQIGPFYNIKTKETFLYDTKSTPDLIQGLNNAIKIKYMKRLPRSEIEKGIDSWIIKSMIKQNPKFIFKHNNSKDCIMGIDTDGFNNISKKRATLFLNKPEMFTPYKDISNFLPEDISSRLNELSTILTGEDTI